MAEYNRIYYKFLSTPSVGRATERWFARHKVDEISIHALRGEGDQHFGDGVHLPGVISIHALRGEGDANSLADEVRSVMISIHALRGEGDAGPDAPR